MINRSLILASVFIFGVVLIISFASARHTWWHFWGEDVQEAPFDATVTVSNTPPTIEKFIAVFEDTDENNVDDVAGTPAGTITGIAGGSEGTGIRGVRFKFVAKDLNNNPGTGTDLPGQLGGGSTPLTVGTNVIVTFTNPANNNRGKTDSATAGNCVVSTCVGNALCNNQAATTQEVLYTCDILMNYFDPSSPNGGVAAADRWTIRVQIFDSTGTNNVIKQSGDAGFNVLNNDYILYNNIQSVSVPASTTLTWSSLNINNPDTPADSLPAPSGKNLIMENGGNIQINSEDVVAKDLVQNGVPANKLLSTAFSAGAAAGGPNSGACDTAAGGGASTFDGTALTNDGVTPVTFTIVVPYTAAGVTVDRSTMFFCIWPVVNPTYLAGSPSTSYVANLANNNRWSVVWKT